MDFARAYAVATTRRMVGREHVDLVAWEVVAVEAMLLLYMKAPEIRNPRPWLCGVIRNLVRRDVFGRRLFTELLSEELPAHEPSSDIPDEEQSKDEEQALRARDQLLAALQSLPSSLRIVAQVFYLEGQSTRAIAASLKITPVTVRKRLERLRTALRKHFAETPR